MDNLQATYKDEEEEDDEILSSKITGKNSTHSQTLIDSSSILPTEIKNESLLSQDSSHFNKLHKIQFLGKIQPKHSPNLTKIDEKITKIDEEYQEENHRIKKQKKLSSFTSKTETTETAEIVVETVNSTASIKKSKKKSSSKKPISRKGKKKLKSNGNGNGNAHVTVKEDFVRITPLSRVFDRNDDTPEMKICLSKMFKAEKVELSEDRLSAGSCKGYRMVRSTRGVSEGAWYFEIKLLKMGVTGHTRLGWSTEKGDLQAPVGYDGNSFGYRDIDGSKIHKALREKYGEKGYEEGDVIGFYINLPDGSLYTPKPPNVVWFKGQKYACAPDAKEDPPKVIPGSEISFFKNGICQGVAFKDLYGGRYYPAASMYTLPDQPNCVVRFNFGPNFKSFPEDFGDRPLPRPMIEVPYHGFDTSFENGKPLVSPRMFPMLKLVNEQDILIVED